MGTYYRCRFKSTVGIKHIGARAWYNLPIDRIRPICPPISPSKGQSGVLQVIDHSVAKSMTAQPTGSCPNASRVATHNQRIAPLGEGFTLLQRCSHHTLQPQLTGHIYIYICVCVCVYIYIYIYIQGSLNMFQTFFVWALLLIVHTWNSNPLWSNLLWLQCTYCTIPTTSERAHGSPLVWACQWPSSQPLSSPQLSHNDSL